MKKSFLAKKYAIKKYFEPEKVEKLGGNVSEEEAVSKAIISIIADFDRTAIKAEYVNVPYKKIVELISNEIREKIAFLEKYFDRKVDDRKFVTDYVLEKYFHVGKTFDSILFNLDRSGLKKEYEEYSTEELIDNMIKDISIYFQILSEYQKSIA